MSNFCNKTSNFSHPCPTPDNDPSPALLAIAMRPQCSLCWTPASRWLHVPGRILWRPVCWMSARMHCSWWLSACQSMPGMPVSSHIVLKKLAWKYFFCIYRLAANECVLFCMIFLVIYKFKNKKLKIDIKVTECLFVYLCIARSH